MARDHRPAARTRVLLAALALAMLCMPARAQSPEPPPSGDGPAAPGPVSPEDLRRARDVLTEYTPAHELYVREFANGLRIAGVTVEAIPAEPEEPVIEGLEFALHGPDWFERSELLGTVAPGKGLRVRLLWEVEPRLRPLPDAAAFSVELNQHQGYGRIRQQDTRTRLDLRDRPYGTVFWSEHRFPNGTHVVPGVFDVVVHSESDPPETRALGQLFVRGPVDYAPHVEREMRTLLPDAHLLFAGHLALTRWYRYETAVDALPFEPSTFVIVSSVDWFENRDDGVLVAEASVIYEGGHRTTFPILLGRDTALTWLEFHKSGAIPHKAAPIAWTWPIQRESVEFDAAVYLARYPLEPGAGKPVRVAIRYRDEEGILRVRGAGFLP